MRIRIPSQRPHFAFLASPIAANAHAMPTLAISKIGNQPID